MLAAKWKNHSKVHNTWTCCQLTDETRTTQLDKELYDLEKDQYSGNTIGAMYYRNAANALTKIT